jgi:hypothetical protein
MRHNLSRIKIIKVNAQKIGVCRAAPAARGRLYPPFIEQLHEKFTLLPNVLGIYAGNENYNVYFFTFCI